MLKFLRISVVATIVVAMFWCRTGQGADAPTKRPNILFIMVDEMKWNVMGCAGHPLVKTPNLDRLAHEGTRFETAYTAAAICSAARYSLFTSRYPHVHGVPDNGTPPKDGQIILPTIMKHYGYQTGLVGKLHFTPWWHDYDFDYFWSYNHEGSGKQQSYPDYFLKKYGKTERRMVDAKSLLYPTDPLGRDIAKPTYPKDDYQSFWITDRATEFLKTRSAPDQPFFLYVSYLEPHSPYHCPEPYWSMYDPKDIPQPNIPDNIKAERAQAIKDNHLGPARHLIDSPTMAQQLTAKYLGHVTNVDDNIGRLLKELEAQGLADNTMIIFTADHGNMLGDLGRWFKGVMYEGATRVPLLIKAPQTGPYAKVFDQGKVVPQVVETIDVLPTLLEMMDIPLPTVGIQGKSLIPLTSGTESNWKDHAFSERGSVMLRTAQYKLIKNQPKEQRKGGTLYELYDLKADPMEEHDLSADAGHKAVLDDLKQQIDTWQKDVPPLTQMDGIKAPPFAYLTDADKKRIKAEGKNGEE